VLITTCSVCGYFKKQYDNALNKCICELRLEFSGNVTIEEINKTLTDASFNPEPMSNFPLSKIKFAPWCGENNSKMKTKSENLIKKGYVTLNENTTMKVRVYCKEKDKDSCDEHEKVIDCNAERLVSLFTQNLNVSLVTNTSRCNVEYAPGFEGVILIAVVITISLQRYFTRNK
jgi:hypothetical protein